MSTEAQGDTALVKACDEMVLLTEKCTERTCGTRVRYSELTDEANTHWHVRRGIALVPLRALLSDAHPAQPWRFGNEAAARYIARTSWPWEREEERDAWASRLITEPDMLDKEAAGARARLEAAIAHLRAARAAGETGAGGEQHG